MYPHNVCNEHYAFTERKRMNTRSQVGCLLSPCDIVNGCYCFRHCLVRWFLCACVCPSGGAVRVPVVLCAVCCARAVCRFSCARVDSRMCQSDGGSAPPFRGRDSTSVRGPVNLFRGKIHARPRPAPTPVVNYVADK